MKNKKGITLIALIITIIVMLILVAVSVQILIKSDLIGTAESAGEAYKTKHEEEQNLSKVTVNGKEYASIDEYMQVNGGLPTIKAGEKAEINSEYKSGKYTAIIPQGFTVSGAATESTIEGGLVVYLIDNKTKEEIAAINWEEDLDSLKTTYDQFVWIPVNDINDMYMCQSEDGTKSCKVTVKEVESKEIAYCTTHNSNLMAGRLYWDDEEHEYAPNLTTQTYNTNSHHEPGAVQPYDGQYTYLENLNGILGTNYSDENELMVDLQKEYNEIVKSVYVNKGFYIGRFETSNMSDQDGNSITVIAGEDEGINNNDWGCMYGQQKDYATNNRLNTIIGSTMIQGAAYDQVMKFVDGTDLGNGVIYDVTTDVETRHTGEVATTGSNLEDIVKNINNLEGNVYAWTITATTYAYECRGGNYESGTASSICNSTYCQNYSDDHCGSICQLYIK